MPAYMPIFRPWYGQNRVQTQSAPSQFYAVDIYCYRISWILKKCWFVACQVITAIALEAFSTPRRHTTKDICTEYFEEQFILLGWEKRGKDLNLHILKNYTYEEGLPFHFFFFKLFLNTMYLTNKVFLLPLTHAAWLIHAAIKTSAAVPTHGHSHGTQEKSRLLIHQSSFSLLSLVFYLFDCLGMRERFNYVFFCSND